MDFRILGSLEVWDGERQLELAGQKRRAVLAFLLLHANEVVAAERLVDQLWGEKAPRNAAGALQTHVSRLRKELGPDVVATRAWGYVLRAEPGSLDLERFERLSAAAENLPARERAGKLREALALWRGRPLEDLAFEPALAADIARLDELHVTVLENRIDADLEAGNHAGLVGELEALIAANPVRDRLRGQLILTLYRCGRQAEALEVYRETRRVLADELGLEPSPELRELERAILQHDPALRGSPVRTAVATQPGIRPGRRRRIYIAASLALLLAGLATAGAYALSTGPTHAAQQPTTPDLTSEQNVHQLAWKSLEPAPRSVLRLFANLNLGAPPGVNPQPRPAEARQVPLPDGGTVYVTPATNGGFCEDYVTGKTAGCDPSRSSTINPTVGFRAKCGAAPDTVPIRLSGHVDAKPGSTLRLEFSDGSSSSVGLTWVGPPVNAGFFEQSAPAGERMAALVLRLPSGKILANDKDIFRGQYTSTPCPPVMPDGTKILVPLARGAETTKARKIISFRATDGSQVYLWLMPRIGGGDCFVFNQGGGCRIPRYTKHDPAFSGDLAPGATRILFFGQTKPQVAMVELRYQNGATERLTPIDGFVLHEIQPVHYRRGTRLVAAVALEQSGKPILTQSFQPKESGVYPCHKPVNHTCP